MNLPFLARATSPRAPHSLSLRERARVRDVGLLLASLLLLTACHGRGPAADPLTDASNPNSFQERWPAAPEPARIGLRTTFGSPSDLGMRSPALQRIAGWITGNQPDKERLIRPCGVAIDEQGVICITDTGSGKFWCLNPKAGEFHIWDKIGPHQLRSPVAIVRSQGVNYLADSALGKVLAFTDNKHLQFEVSDSLARPSGLAVDRQELFVVDSANHRVDVFDLGGRPLRRLGRRGVQPGEFNFPTHIAVDPAGRLLVTDALNGRVQVLERDGRPVRVISSLGDSSGHLSRPKGIAVDPKGHVYVADALFDNFQVFDGDGRFLLPVGRTGKRPGEFWLPTGVAVSGQRILVADSYNQRVQVFEYVAAPL
ncbi:MAG: hypothetical protein IT581_22630 [Verrucomicrobiales bacterium]|nr:hypothetical protein [Verrucomicrobiales bacterium]